MLSLQITSLLCYIHVNALILTNELKKLNAIEIEGVEPSVLIQDTTHKAFGDMRNRLVNSLAHEFLLLFGYFWFSSSFFLDVQ